MDVFSDALTALRTGTPVFTRTDARAPWSMRFPAVSGASFHVALHGSCLLLPLDDGAPTRLDTGDIVFLRQGSGHTLCSDPVLTPDVFAQDRIDDSSYIRELLIDGKSVDQRVPVEENQPVVGCGLYQDGPGARTLLACGAYKLDITRQHPLLAGMPAVIHLPAAGHQPALRIAVGQLTGEMDDPGPGSDSIVAALIDLLLLLIMRAWYQDITDDHAKGWSAAVSDPLIAPALGAIHADPGHPWTVEELSRASGLSRAAFAKRFTAVLGEPPLSYLTSWRMTTAGRLLRETDARLSTVAERTGYRSEFAFAKAFKREYGAAPGSYRRASRTGFADEQLSG
ncbi:AraC family transcriptional regulator [Nocardia sp. NPDC051052]|uniref:AraC family transcriptional regulator n=1 Tax=Nocardia sp. NPDC051052 TaxID=3364322 RepID=UPI0037AD6ACC